MKQSIYLKMLSCIVMLCAILGTCMVAGAKDKTCADLVVYGKIFTSENNRIVEAFAVKDGKFIYVGDKKTLNLLLKTARKLLTIPAKVL